MKSIISKRFEAVYITTLSILSGIGFFVTMLSNDYSKSLFLPSLPMIYLTLLFLLSNYITSMSSIVTLLIMFAYFIRMVICPLLLSLSNYTTEIRNSVAYSYMDWAILLMIYEVFATFVFILVNREQKKTIFIRNTIKVKTEKMHPIVLIILLGISIFFVSVFFINKDYLMIFRGITDVIGSTEDDRIYRNITFSVFRDSSSRIVFQFFGQAMYFGQIFLPAYLLYIYTNVFISNEKKSSSRYKGLVFFLLVIAISFSFYTDDYAKSIYIAAAVAISVWASYPKKFERIIPVLGVVGSMATIYILFKKVQVFNIDRVGIWEMSKLLNAYFSGPSNISCGLAVEYDNKLLVLWGDLTRSIPLVSHFFTDLTRSQDLFNDTLYGFSGMSNQIMPTICYGYQYFGIFAPTFTLLMYKFAYINETKFKESSSIFNKMIYAFLFISFSIYPSMYMATSCFTLYLYSVIFNWLLKINDSYQSRKYHQWANYFL